MDADEVFSPEHSMTTMYSTIARHTLTHLQFSFFSIDTSTLFLIPTILPSVVSHFFLFSSTNFVGATLSHSVCVCVYLWETRESVRYGGTLPNMRGHYEEQEGERENERCRKKRSADDVYLLVYKRVASNTNSIVKMPIRWNRTDQNFLHCGQVRIFIANSTQINTNTPKRKHRRRRNLFTVCQYIDRIDQASIRMNKRTIGRPMYGEKGGNWASMKNFFMSADKWKGVHRLNKVRFSCC